MTKLIKQMMVMLLVAMGFLVKNNTRLGTALFLGCALFYFMVSNFYPLQPQRPMNVWITRPPYSADPIDYDAFAHHETFRSVLAGVVSQYRVGEYVGVLADRWSASDDFRQWRFRVREGLKYENGDAITTKTIVHSWMRLAYLLKKRQAANAVFDNLEGHEGIDSPHSQISGLSYTETDIILKFLKSEPKLLEKISFGLFSVVHPDDYDGISGEWRDKKKVTASYAYSVKSWDENEFVLNRRDDFLKGQFHPNMANEVRFGWNPKSRQQADLIAADSTIQEHGGTHHFFGKTPSGIAYVHCLSWMNPNSPFHSRAFRTRFRDRLYQNLEKAGLRVTRSFFPLAMKGIQEFTSTGDGTVTDTIANGLEVYFRKLNSDNLYFRMYDATFAETARQMGLQANGKEITVATLMNELDPELKEREIDVAGIGTGVLIEDPHADIRFMIESKSGVRLPDEDGSIRRVLQKEDFSPQEINQLLWDQAIIWPLGHYSMGLWASEQVDLSWHNNILPPLELEWIGWK